MASALIKAPPSGIDLGGGAFIIIPASLQGDAAIRLAASDLARAVRAALGLTPMVATDLELRQLPSRALVVLLGNRENRWVDLMSWQGELAIPPLSEDGYLLQGLRHGESIVIVASGGGVRGTAYSAFNLVERLRLDPRPLLLRPFSVTTEPHMRFRLVSSPDDADYPPPEEALRWGYNAIAIPPWPALALYDNFDAAIYSRWSNPQDRAWVEEKRRQAAERIAAAKALHLMVVSPGDVPSLPRQAITRYQTLVATGSEPPRLCIDRPVTQWLLRQGLDEVLRAFPEIDAIMVRTGESYPQGPLLGTALAEAHCGPGGSAVASNRTVIDLLGKLVVDVHGKTYIHRAWDLGADGFHARPQVAAQVLAGMPADERMVFSFKHTETDFWRYNRLNPNLGQGHHRQMVEYQAAREYEGKGAFPNYLGEVYASGGPEVGPGEGMGYLYRAGVRNIWVWARGGGWGGPTPASDLWVDANRYALSRLAWDTSLAPEAIAHDWATLRFGPGAAPAMARMLLRSAHAVLKGFYVEPYARAQGPWTPNALWVRDDGIFGGAKVAELHSALTSEAAFQLALAERADAVALVNEMLGDFEAADPHIKDRALAQEVYHSLLYEQALLETFQHYLSAMFYYFRWQKTRELAPAYRAQEEFAAWEQSWHRYNSDVASLHRGATPFYNRGMVETALYAWRDMEAKAFKDRLSP